MVPTTEGDGHPHLAQGGQQWGQAAHTSNTVAVLQVPPFLVVAKGLKLTG